MADYYRVLGLDRGTPPEEVAQRYRQLTSFLQSPAIPADLRPWARQQLASLNEAYAALREHHRSPTPAPEPRPGRRRLLFPVLGGVLLGLAVLLGGTAATGQWDRMTGLFTGGSAEDATGGMEQLRVRQLQDTLATDPLNQQALFDLGEFYFQDKQWQQAINWFGQLLEVDPNNTHALNDVALSLFYLGQYSRAEATWHQALEVDPDDPLLHYSLGYLYRNRPTPDLPAAASHLQEVLRLAPESELAQTARADLQAMGPLPTTTTPPPGTP